MSTRKIAQCINVRINVAQYEHIEFTKYGEEEIEFSSAEERVQKEDALREDLVASLMRDFREVPKQLGKGLAQALKVEETIKKVLPQWLSENPVPNIANTAQKADIKNTAKQFVEKAAAAPAVDVEVFEEKKVLPVNDSVVVASGDAQVPDLTEKELFDTTPVAAPVEVLEPVAEVVAPVAAEVVPAKDDDGFDDVFGGEDIFEDGKA